MEHRPTNDLTVHPMLRHMPEWQLDDPRMAALTDDIVARGIDQPLIIDPHNRILDGRHRWRAAKHGNLPQCPVIVRAQSDAAGIILGSILQRRHYAKSALAYMAYPLLEKGLWEARTRARAGLKSGQKPQCFPSTIQSSTENLGEGSDLIPSPHDDPDSLAASVPSEAPLEHLRVRDYAIELGVSHDLVTQAGKVHEIFAQDPEYQALMEPRILEGDVGLGGVIAGWGGRRTTAGQPRTPTQHEHLWIRTIRSLAIRTARIEDLTVLRPALRDIVDRIEDPAALTALEQVGKAIAHDSHSRHLALTSTT